MTAPTSLLDWILSLLRDPDARAAFQSNPRHYAASHGFQDLSSADVHDALYLIADNGSASYDHQFSSRGEVHYPPPHHYDAHQPAGDYLRQYLHQYTVATGGGNVGADHSTVTGDDDITAFGSGDASRDDTADPHTGSGGGLSLGWDTYGHDTANETTTSMHDYGSGDTSVDAAGVHGAAEQYAEQSEHTAYDDVHH